MSNVVVFLSFHVFIRRMNARVLSPSLLLK